MVADTKAQVAEDQKTGGEPSADETVASYALIFELEGVAVSARKAEYDVLSSLLSDHGVKLSPVHYSRFCLQNDPATYVPNLLKELGSKKLSADRLAEEIRSGINMYLTSKDATIHPALEKIVEESARRGMPIGAITTMKEPAGLALLGRWNRLAADMQLFVSDARQKSFPRADNWLKAAKAFGRTARQCLAIAGSMVSAKSALSAGMRCVVIPDEFTAFQDFSGVDAVVESVEELNVKKLLDDICPLQAIR